MSRLTQELLDNQGCDTPNCTHDHSILYFHPSCHGDAYLQARYVKTTGVLELLCEICDKMVAEVDIPEK